MSQQGLMSRVTRDDAPAGTSVVGKATDTMADLVAKLRGGAVLVTAVRTSRGRKRMLAELDGATVSVATVKACIARRLVVEAGRTASTTTWQAAGGE